jgi:TOTE conflict system, Archaeo-Eukaryotic Primase domain
MSVRTTQTKIELFRRFFTGLLHVYGTYDTASQCAHQIKAPVTDAVILAHLQGRQFYGVYLLVENKIRAIVADFDDYDVSAPMEFVSAARVYDIPAHIERSKSKGYHVWIFFDEGGVHASKARLVVHRILAEIEKPRTEVSPKQDSLNTSVTYGNFINAPLFGAIVSKGRTVFVDAGDPSKVHPDQWAFLEGINRVTEQLLDDVIEVNDLRGPTQSDLAGKPTPSADVRCYGLPPCARTILADGVTANQRVTCFRLAVGLKRAGLPFDSAIAVLSDWATRNRPVNGKKIITKHEVTAQAACAYDKAYRACGCEDPAIQPFCESTCRINKSATREHTVREALS